MGRGTGRSWMPVLAVMLGVVGCGSDGNADRDAGGDPGVVDGADAPDPAPDEDMEDLSSDTGPADGVASDTLWDTPADAPVDTPPDTAADLPACDTNACPGGQVCRDGTCVDPVLPAVRAGATEQVGNQGADRNVLIDGRLIRPAVPGVLVGTLPANVETSPDGAVLVVNENGFGTPDAPGGEGDTARREVLRVLDATTLDVVQEVPMPGRSMYFGLRFDLAGTRLYVAGGQDQQVHVYAVDADHRLALERSLDAPGCYVTDVALSPAEDRLYASCVLSDRVVALDLDPAATGAPASWFAGKRPFTLWVQPGGGRLWVSNWNTVAKPADGDTLTVLDTATGDAAATVNVGWSPEGLVASADGTRLWSVGGKTDDVWEVDVAAATARRLLSLHADPAAPKGIQPVLATLSPDGETLYVASAGDNCVDVVDLASATVRGRIPTDWYPADVALSPAGDVLYVANAKGRGDGPGGDGASSGRALRGTVMRIPLPDAATLADWTARVAQNNARQAGYFDLGSGNDTPLPSTPGAPSDRIRHVFFVMKENMAYDSVFGDLDRGDGNPDFVLWNEDVAPNHRRLAREYTLLDAFYTDGESSVAGHQWAMAAVEPDFWFKSWVLSYADYGFPELVYGIDPGSFVESDFFMTHLLRHGVGVRGYGGIEHLTLALADFPDAINSDFPNFGVEDPTPDPDRARIFVDEFRQLAAAGQVPPFVYVFLPTNHTRGLEIGVPTPETYVAGNDEALGMVVEAIAASPVWESSVIFVYEDDAQNGYDHVDKHRCAALAIGPWVKRGYVSHVTYSFPNLHKTAELLLGVPPMTANDHRASGMHDLFVARPDPTPYVKEPRRYPDTIYRGGNPAAEAVARRMRFDRTDDSPLAAEVMWRHVKRRPPPVLAR